MTSVEASRSFCTFRSSWFFLSFTALIMQYLVKTMRGKKDQTNRVVLSHRYDRTVKLMAKSN